MLCIHQPALKTDEAILAYAYLKSIGAIIVKADAPPHKVKAPKIPKGRIGWKRLNPTGWHERGSMCDQCGKDSGSNGRNGGIATPYNMALCSACFKVHTHSLARGLVPTEEITW